MLPLPKKSSSKLVQYPYEGENLHLQESAQIIRNKFQFTPKDDRFIQKLNFKRLGQEIINNHVATCMTKPKKLWLCVKIVYLSKECKAASIAAANAITILKQTGYSFAAMELREISVPGADLSSAIFDRADLSYADLSDTNLSNSSLRRTTLEGTILHGANFGQLPYFIHDSPLVHAVALLDRLHLISCDQEHVYLWSMQEGEKEHLIGKASAKSDSFPTTISPHTTHSPNTFLLPINGGKHCLRVHGSGIIELWNITPLEKLHETIVTPDLREFVFLTLDKRGEHLLAVGRKALPNSSDYMVFVWKIAKDVNGVPRLTERRSQLILETINHCAFSKEKALLAISLKSSIEFCSLSTLDVDDTLSIPVNKKRITSLHFAGDKLLVAEENRVYAWDIYAKKRIPVFEETDPRAYINSMQLLPNSSLIAYKVGFCTVRIRDMSGDNAPLKMQHEFRDEKNEKAKTQFLSDGKRLVSHFNNKIVISQIENSFIQKIIPFEIMSANFSSNSEFIFLLNRYGELFYYNARTGLEASKRDLKEHKMNDPHFVSRLRRASSQGEGSYFCSLSKNTTFLIGVQKKHEKATIHFSNLENGETYCKMVIPYAPFALTPDSTRLVLVHNKELQLWQTFPQAKIATIPLERLGEDEEIEELFLSPQLYPENYVIIVEKTKTTIWKINWTEQTSQSISLLQYKISGVQFIAPFAFLYQHLNSVMLWNLVTHDLYLQIEHENLSHFCASANGNFIVTVSSNSQAFESHLKVWLERKPFDELIVSLLNPKIQIAPSSRFLLCWGESNLYCWEIEENSMHLIWKSPQRLRAKEARIQKAQMSESNRRLLLQLQAKA